MAENTTARCVGTESWLGDMACKLAANGYDLVSEFLLLVDGVWNSVFLGLSVSNILIGLLVFYAFVLLRSLFSRFVIAAARRLAKRSQTNIDDVLLECLEGPLRMLPIIMGVFFGGQILVGFESEPNATYAVLLQQSVQSLIAVAIFWSLYNLVEPASQAFEKVERFLTDAMTAWVVKSLKAVFALMGGAAVLEIWGIPVGPLVASLGLFGVAVALGAQDLFKNLIGGLSILMEKRYHTGDWVLVDGVVEGTVENIGFRSTVVRRFDKAPVFVPNDVLSNSAVTNFSEMTHRRIYWKIGIEYRSTIEQLRKVRDGIEGYVLGKEDFASPEDVATFVRVDSFNNSSIDLMLYCFTITTNWGEWLKIKEELALAIKEIVEGAGTSFAFPSQSIYVESLPGQGPEIFVPPATT